MATIKTKTKRKKQMTPLQLAKQAKVPEIIAKFQAGVPREEIADQTTMSLGFVDATIHAAGVPRNAIRAKNREACIEAVRSGVDVEDAAKEFGFSVTYTNRITIGVPRKFRGKPNYAGYNRTFEIAGALKAGRSIQDVAEEFGISRQRVHQIYKSAVKAGLFGETERPHFSTARADVRKQEIQAARQAIQAQKDATRRELQQRVIAAWNETQDVNETAERIGLCISTTYRTLNENGINPRKKDRSIHQILAVVKELIDTQNCVMTAERLGVPLPFVHYVSRRCREVGLLPKYGK